jgi:hypothetical protein
MMLEELTTWLRDQCDTANKLHQERQKQIATTTKENIKLEGEFAAFAAVANKIEELISEPSAQPESEAGTDEVVAAKS